MACSCAGYAGCAGRSDLFCCVAFVLFFHGRMSLSLRKVSEDL